MRFYRSIFFVSAFVLFCSPGPYAAAQERLPLFDTHVHYSRPDWDVYPPAQILKILAAAGVKRALVSSTPDDGTLKLFQADPKRIAPNLRPYRTQADMSGWAKNQEVLDYVAGRLKSGIYKGVGEFHLFDAKDAASPQMKALVRLAVQRNIVLQIHSDAKPVEVLFSHSKKLKILWAHAGMSEPAGTVRAMMDKYKNLWAGVSFRADDIAPGGKIDTAWHWLFLRHPDRFVYGTDTYITERWAAYGDLVEEHRAWLNQLPRKIARKIAYQNAVRLFGGGGAAGLPE